MDLVAFGGERRHHRAADEAGRAGDQHFHRGPRASMRSSSATYAGAEDEGDDVEHRRSRASP